MRANTHLVVRTENSVAVFTMPLYPGFMMFIGASCKASAQPGQISQEVTVTVPEGEKALVAIRTTHQRNKQEGGGSNEVTCVIPITWEGNKMFADLERPFVSSPDRLLQVSSDYVDPSVLITTGEQEFVSASPGKKDEWVSKGYRFVNDPNLLLRFAVGQATLEDLEAAATMDQRSQTERELAQVKAKLETMVAEERHNEVLGEMTSLKNQLTVTEAKLAVAQNRVDNLKTELEPLVKMRKSIEEILNNVWDGWSQWGSPPWVKVRKIRRLLKLEKL